MSLGADAISAGYDPGEPPLASIVLPFFYMHNISQQVAPFTVRVMWLLRGGKDGVCPFWRQVSAPEDRFHKMRPRLLTRGSP